MKKLTSPSTQANDDSTVELKPTRRQVLQFGSALSAAGIASGYDLLSLSSTTAYAAGSDKPEKSTLKVGFSPLTDCASMVVASVMGFDKKYGITIELSKEAS